MQISGNFYYQSDSGGSLILFHFVKLKKKNFSQKWHFSYLQYTNGLVASGDILPYLIYA